MRRSPGLLQVPEPPEAVFRQQVYDLARLQGWLVYFTWNSLHSPPGFPDLVMVRGRRTIFAELKSASGQLTLHQRKWLWALAAAGQEVWVWKPEAWRQVEGVLARPILHSQGGQEGRSGV